MRQTLHRVIADPGIDERSDDGEREHGDDEVVAVGVSIGDGLHADRTTGAGARLHKELLLKRAREMIGDDASQNVGSATGREGVDDAHRPRRPVLRRRGSRDDEGAGESKERQTFHVPSSSSRPRGRFHRRPRDAELKS
jgi:hypothetical protein